MYNFFEVEDGYNVGFYCQDDGGVGVLYADTTTGFVVRMTDTWKSV